MNIQVSEKLFNDCIHSLQQLIRIPSVKSAPAPAAPFGEAIGEALHYFLEKARSFDLQVKQLDGYAGIVEMGGGSEELGILVHLDVVPTGDESRWRFPPFSAKIQDGAIWGRGTLDDKGPAMAVLYAMKLLKEANLAWDKRVRLIIGTDEESTWEDIQYYKEREHPPTIAFTPDGCFPVTNSEKGILTIAYEKALEATTMVSRVEAGKSHNMFPASAKAVITLSNKSLTNEIVSSRSVSVDHQTDGTVILTAKGTEGHSSSPVAENNAIHILLKALKSCLPDQDGFWEVIRFYEQFLEETDGNGLDCQLRDEVSGELTLATTVLNFDGETASFISNMRYPSTFEGHEIKQRLKRSLEESSFAWKVLMHKEAVYFSSESTLVRDLLSVYHDYFDCNDPPQSISGGTYARAFPNTVAFGALIPGKPLNAHQVDEHVELQVIRDWIYIYASAIYKLAAKKVIADGK